MAMNRFALLRWFLWRATTGRNIDLGCAHRGSGPLVTGSAGIARLCPRAMSTAPQLQKRCTKMDVRNFGGAWGWCGCVCGGGDQRFFRLLRVETARLVLKLRAGARRAARPSALGGQIKGLKGQKGGACHSRCGGVVAGRAWCCKLAAAAALSKSNQRLCLGMPFGVHIDLITPMANLEGFCFAPQVPPAPGAPPW
jgi:hypothetical protein